MCVSGNTTKAMAAVVVVLLVAAAAVEGYPRTRSMKDHRRNLAGSIENSIMNAKPVCDYSVPCGWALYHQRASSALRPIYDYTKNTFCQCDYKDECVYKENRIEMRAYVFYCREASKNEDSFKFPANIS